jgi:hypothetical protein
MRVTAKLSRSLGRLGVVLRLPPVLSQPLIAQQPEISWTFHERRKCRGDSGKQDDPDVNPEHRRTLYCFCAR